MINNIDMSGISGSEYRIIGTSSNPFEGVFNGNNLTISNFSCTTGSYAGLFGYIENSGGIGESIIQNICLKDVNVQGDTAGALAAYCMNTYIGIINCSVTGGSVTASSYAGGLVAKTQENTEFENCFTTCNVSGAQAGGIIGESYGSIYGFPYLRYCYSTGTITCSGEFCGGIVAYNFEGEFYRCYSTGDIISSGGHTGGLVGMNYSNDNDIKIEECWSTSNVTDTGTSGSTGGLVGINYASWMPITTINCYAKGTVIGPNVGASDNEGFTGGLVGASLGLDNDTTIENCYSSGYVSGPTGKTGGLNGGRPPVMPGLGTEYFIQSFWDVNTSGQTTSIGGEGKTTEQMKTQSTFTDAGWNFSTVWSICEITNYPRLIWSISLADLSRRREFL
jgi:hypothetical protein